MTLKLLTFFLYVLFLPTIISIPQEFTQHMLIGVTGKMSTASQNDDDNFGSEMSQAAILKVLINISIHTTPLHITFLYLYTLITLFFTETNIPESSPQYSPRTSITPLNLCTALGSRRVANE